MNENREPYSYSFEPVDHDSRMQMNGGNAFTPPEAPKPKKGSHGAKIVAVAVACALVGGVGGSAMTAYLLDQHTTNTQTQVAAETPTEDENVVVNRVVHTNTGDKNLTPKEVYDMYVDSTVGITTTGTTSNGYWTSEFSASGSGFIISEDGYIVTNHHVIEGAETVTVHRLDGSASYDALLVGSDAASDLAVLKVEAQGLTAAEFGDSALVQVGDVALAIGNPLGEQLPGTMTDGIISYIDRSVTVDGYEMQLIQTSAALNSGNSGGALLNEYGQVVGVTTLKMSSNWDTIEALGFAIPTATVKEIVDDLIAHGAVSGRPTIGITVCAVSALPPEEAEGLPQDGLYVVSVEEGSDALEQGLRAGDVILEANGTEVSTIEDLNDQKTGLSVGDALTLTVFRDGETFTVEIHLVEQYQLEG